jgi:hypothetical protein
MMAMFCFVLAAFMLLLALLAGVAVAPRRNNQDRAS